MADLKIRVLLTSKDAGFAKAFRGSVDDVRALTKELRSLAKVMAKLGGATPIANPFREASSAIRDTAEETKRLNEQLKEAAKAGRRVRITPDTLAGGAGEGTAATPRPRRARSPRVGPDGAVIDPSQPRVRRRVVYAPRERDPGEDQDRWGARIHHTGLSMERAAYRTGQALMSVIGPTMEYERAMVNTIAVTDDASENLSNEKVLRDASLSFSKFGYGATDTTKALEFMALAGFKTKEQLAAIPHVLDAARAGSEDLEKSSGLLVDTMTAFGKKAGDMQQVADVMTYVNNKTNTTLSLTARAMFEIGPYAVDAGLSMESMAAAVGVLAEAGIKGSKAGTAVRNMLLFLSKPAKPAREEIDKLGLSFKELNGYIAKNDLSGAIVRIDDAMKEKGYDAADRRRVYGTVFGSYTAGKAGIIAQSARSGRFKEFEQGALDSTGATNKAAMRKLKSSPGRLDIMKAKLEEVQITLGQKVLPELLPVAEGLLDVATRFAQFAKENPGFVRAVTSNLVALTAVNAAVGPVLTTLGGVTRFGAMLQTLGNASKSATTVASTTATTVSSAADALKSVGTQAGTAEKSVGKLSGILGKVGAGLGSASLVVSAAMAGYAAGTFLDELLGISDILSGTRDQATMEEKWMQANHSPLTSKEMQDVTASKKRAAEIEKTKAAHDAGSEQYSGVRRQIRGKMSEQYQAQIEQEAKLQKSIQANANLRAIKQKATAPLVSDQMTKYAENIEAFERMATEHAEDAERARKRGNSKKEDEALGRRDEAQAGRDSWEAHANAFADRSDLLAGKKFSQAERADRWRSLIKVEVDVKNNTATVMQDGREIGEEGIVLPEGM